tara:strand:- start:10452 stop:10976 length:525 start_codon:yes stop_codon:yes gene_type:complete
MTARKYRYDQKEIKNELTKLKGIEIMEEKGYARVTGQERITTTVFLYDTPIVSFYYDNEKNERGNSVAHVKLTSGGWNTPLTKSRINRVSAFYNLNFSVEQKKFQWFTFLITYDEGMQFLPWRTFDPTQDAKLDRQFDMNGLTYCGFTFAPSENIWAYRSSYFTKNNEIDLSFV